MIKKIKILFRGRVLLVILMVKKFLEHFTKKNCKKQIKNSLELKTKSREKMIKYMVSGKVMIIHVIVGLIKKMLLYKMSYFSEPYTSICPIIQQSLT